MEDGINEYGLAIGLTAVYPTVKQLGLNAGMMLRLFLEKCKTVDEVIQLLNTLPIASSQTFTLVDTGGDIALIECNSKLTGSSVKQCGNIIIILLIIGKLKSAIKLSKKRF